MFGSSIYEYYLSKYLTMTCIVYLRVQSGTQCTSRDSIFALKPLRDVENGLGLEVQQLPSSSLAQQLGLARAELDLEVVANKIEGCAGFKSACKRKGVELQVACRPI